MSKIKLDAQTALAATCPPGKRKIDVWDTHIPGFVLEVRASGGKTFALRYHDASGRQRQHKIGGFHEITCAEARKMAQKLRSQVVMGDSPAAQKATKRSIGTYGDLAVQHLAHAETYQKSFDSTEINIRVHILPRWGKVRLDDIRKQDVAAWLAEKRASGLSPATVEKIRVVFGRSFELGRQWDIAGIGANPTRGIAGPKINNARQRYLTTAEAKRLLDAAGGSSNTQLQAIVGLLLLTGARRAELLQAEWRNVDLERRAWLIPDSKTGKPRYVPLSQPAIDVIEGLPRFDGCPYLLPNPDTLKPFVTIKRAFATARDEAGMPDLHLHDLRHSAASFMINAGIDLYAVGRVLGHADHKSTMRYSHLANDTLLAAVEAGAAKMAGGRV